MRNVVDFHPAKNLTPNIFVNTWYRWPIANPLSGPPAILSSPGCLMSVQQVIQTNYVIIIIDRTAMTRQQNFPKCLNN